MAKITHKLTFFRILRSEWIKIFSVRSTWWILFTCIVLNIAISVGLAASMWMAEQYMNESPPQGGGQEPMVLLSEIVAMGCGFVGQLVFMILSILIITNEYSTGAIVSTLTAAPRRIRVLMTKMIVIVILCILVFAICVAASWGISYLILQGSSLVDLTLISDTSLRILLGFIAEMVLIALFCFGLGSIIRSTAGSIGTAVGVILILPLIMSLVSNMLSGTGEVTGWRQWIINATEFLPTNAGSLVTQANPASTLLTPWQGIGVLGIWAFVAILVGLITTARRNV